MWCLVCLRYRIQRYWLTGDKAGTSDVFADNLPGCPDNINSNGMGVFWIALALVSESCAQRKPVSVIHGCVEVYCPFM